MGFSLGGNWIDLIILFILVIYAVEGWRRGFIHGWIDVGGFLLSLLLALRFYGFAAAIMTANFNLPRGIANALGFLIIASVVELLFYFLVLYISRFFNRKWIENRLNVTLGFIPAVVSGGILIAFLLTTLLVLPIRPDLKQDILNSRLGGFMASQTLVMERYIQDIFGGAVQDTLTFLTVKPQANETVNLNFKTSNTTVDVQSEFQMLGKVNAERKKRGLSVLTMNEPLRDVAREHCKDMFVRGYFSHYTPEGLSPFNRMEKAGIEYRTAGENLAYAPTVDIAHTGLMNSEGHRANILSEDFGQVGIGVINAGVYGRMFCQEFRD